MWDFYDLLGCVHYGIAFKRNAAAKVAYFAAEQNPDDESLDPIATKTKEVIDAVDRLHGPFGGLKEIVAELMIHINVPGEGYLVGKDGLEGEEWDVWSVEEIQKARGAEATKIFEPDIAEADEGSFACRIWRPHPRDRSKADAPLRPVSEQCEQLLLLEDSISAAAKSRLSAGLFYVPNELSIGDTKAFENELIAILTTPIKDTESAARWTPGLLRGPAEYADKVRLISFAREIDATFADLREELVRAIAAGLDLPAEIILGKGELNHWNNWGIDESAFRDHVDPDLILIMDSITRGYLHPALKEAGVPDPEKYLIWRDLSDLGQTAPTIPEAIELNAAGIVNDEYVRDLIGASDDDKPKEEEAPQPAPAIVGEFPVEGMPENTGPPSMPLVAAVDTRPLTELSKIDRLLLERISEASEAAFGRVLERAGAKIRSHAKKDRGISATIERTPNDQVTSLLGERLVAQLQITPGELVPADSFDPLAKRLRTLLANAAKEIGDRLEGLTGERPPDDSGKREAAIAAFLASLSAFALRLLFRPSAAPDPGEVGDTILPAGMVVDLLTQAGGSAQGARVRGFAAGADSLGWLLEHGIRIAGHRWEYGDESSRQQPFPPHRDLDQFEFSDWTDDRLETPLSAQWLSVTHMFPGDHRGCRCLTVPVMIEERRAA